MCSGSAGVAVAWGRTKRENARRHTSRCPAVDRFRFGGAGQHESLWIKVKLNCACLTLHPQGCRRKQGVPHQLRELAVRKAEGRFQIAMQFAFGDQVSFQRHQLPVGRGREVVQVVQHARGLGEIGVLHPPPGIVVVELGALQLHCTFGNWGGFIPMRHRLAGLERTAFDPIPVFQIVDVADTVLLAEPARRCKTVPVRGKAANTREVCLA